SRTDPFLQGGSRASAARWARRAFAWECRRLAVADRGAARVRQLADQPVGLQRIAEPGLCPALVDAAAHGAFADSLTPFVEQRQLAARLADAPAQPLVLLWGGPMLAVEVEDERFLKHSQSSRLLCG